MHTKLRILVCLILASGLTALIVATAASAVPLIGPGYPAPGGNDFGAAGGDRGDVGGADITYSNFDPGEFTALYWGPQWGATPPSAWLDGNPPNDLSFLSISGSTATWSGLTDYTAPVGDPTYSSCTDCPIKLEVTITSGAVGWVTEGSVSGLTALAPGIGAVVDNSAGVDFTVKIALLADVGNGFEAINPIHQTGGQTGSSVSGAFYSLPEPSTLMLLGVGLIAVAARRGRN